MAGAGAGAAGDWDGGVKRKQVVLRTPESRERERLRSVKRRTEQTAEQV